MQHEGLLLTPEECAEKYRVSLRTVYRWIHTGYQDERLYATKVGRQWRINESTLESFLRKLRHLV